MSKDVDTAVRLASASTIASNRSKSGQRPSPQPIMLRGLDLEQESSELKPVRSASERVDRSEDLVGARGQLHFRRGRIRIGAPGDRHKARLHLADLVHAEGLDQGRPAPGFCIRRRNGRWPDAGVPSTELKRRDLHHPHTREQTGRPAAPRSASPVADMGESVQRTTPPIFR